MAKPDDDSANVALTLLYRTKAALYDKIYDFKDHAAEADRVAQTLAAEGVVSGRLLEAACGTGVYLGHLCDRYEVSGFDLNIEMVEIARRRLPNLPETRIFVADMVNFGVARPFDALVCLFSSVGYVFPIERLESAAGSFFAALRPGGVCLVEPWLTPEICTPNHLSQQTYDAPDLKIVRAGVTRVIGRVSRLDLHYLVTTTDGVEYFTERHDLWLYTVDEMCSAFASAGFEVDWRPADGLEASRGLLVCKRPDSNQARQRRVNLAGR